MYIIQNINNRKHNSPTDVKPSEYLRPMMTGDLF